MENIEEKINLVPLSSYNIPIVASFEKKYFSQPWSEHSLREELSSSNSYFRVAVLEDRVIGYIGMYCVCKEGYITNFAVDKDFRRQGIGRFILKECLKFASDNRFSLVSLEVRVSNLAAAKLYLSEGFKRVGMRRKFYKRPEEDAIIFTKYFYRG